MSIRWYRRLRWALFAIPIIVFIWILEQNLFLFSDLHIDYTPGDPSPYVQSFAPSEEYHIFGDDQSDTRRTRFQVVTSNRIQSHISLPRLFSGLDLGILYQPLSSIRQIDVRLRRGNVVGPLQTVAIHEPLIDSVLRGTEKEQWFELISGTIKLWQREQQYASVEDFFVNPPFPDTFVTSNINPLAYSSSLTDFVTGQPFLFTTPLYGPHKAVAYIPSGAYSFVVTLRDLNEKDGVDNGFISMIDMQAQRAINTVVISDIDDRGPTHIASEDKKYELKGAVETGGMYVFDIKITRDVQIRSLRSSTPLYFQNKIILDGDSGSSAQTAMTLHTNSSAVSIRTNQEIGLGSSIVGGQKLLLEKTKTWYPITGLSGSTIIELPSTSTILEFDGLVSLHDSLPPDPLLLPSRSLSDVTTLQDIGYVLADQPTLTQVGRWYSSEASLGYDLLQQTLGKDFTLEFLITDTGNNQPVLALRNIQLLFRRDHVAESSQKE